MRPRVFFLFLVGVSCGAAAVQALALSQPEDDDLLSCQMRRVHDIVMRCGSNCRILRNKYKLQNGKKFCSYTYGSGILSLQEDRSVEVARQRLQATPPCVEYVHETVWFDSNGSALHGPIIETISTRHKALPVREPAARVKAHQNTYLEVTWKAPITNCKITCYNISYTHVNLPHATEHGWIVRILPNDEQEIFRHKILSVEAFALYEICLTADTDEEIGEPACIKVLTPARVIQAPKSLELVDRTSSSLMVRWTPPGGEVVAQYELSLAEARLQDFPVLIKYFLPGDTTQFTVGQLLPGQDYNISLNIIDKAGAAGELIKETFTTDNDE